ncbi:MAG: tetratricopeptide repeat protein [Alphaproteobacteria bacterium]|nr:tetratricopeptide repeat protein [Alphaproteobacteria bacterium]
MNQAHDIRLTLQEAMALHQRGDAARAESMYRDVLSVLPEEPNALHLLGVLAWQRNDLPVAEEFIRRAIKIHPKVSAYYNNLGGVLKQKGDLPDAVRQYDVALRISPRDEVVRKALSQTLHQHGMALAGERKWEDAKAAYQRVLDLEPDNLATLNNLASIVQHLNDRPTAHKLYAHALKVAPDNLLVRYNRSICYLTEARLEEGWNDFIASASYWHDKQDNRPGLPWLHLPLWKGDAAPGQRILLWGSQGIGDEIVYASMVPDLLERGLQVTIECAERLVPIFARSFPGTTVIARQSPPLPGADFDCQTPGMWLGRWLRPNLQSFPPRKAFLKPEPELTARLRQRYEAFGKKRILGLSWFTASKAWGEKRSIELPDMLRLLPLKDLLVVDLQYGETADAWREARKIFPDLTMFHDPEVDQFKDMDAFTAQVAACDHIYTISNTTSHVAGAVGVPATVLMPEAGLSWYWFDKGEACPWYPSLRLLRPDLPNRLEAAAMIVHGT